MVEIEINFSSVLFLILTVEIVDPVFGLSAAKNRNLLLRNSEFELHNFQILFR